MIQIRILETHIQKMSQKYTSKNYNNQLPPPPTHFLHFKPCYLLYINPHHNGRHVTTVLYFYHPIKVTPQNWEGGRRSEWSESFFPNLKWKNQKWTFINVHFPKKVFRFEKNIDFVTQTIMLTFTFLRWKKCYHKFSHFLRHSGGRPSTPVTY